MVNCPACRAIVLPGGFRRPSIALTSRAVTTGLVQLITLALAAIALVVGAWLLIVGKRPWRGSDDQRVAPRVRLLGFSYMLVFGSAMIQIVLEPRGVEAEALGGLMVLGGVIVIVVVLLEARASRRSAY